MASGICIANALSDSGGAATAGERYSIHDLVFEDINGVTYKGFGVFAMIISNAPPLRDIKIEHVTAFPPRVSLNIGADQDKPRPTNFSITNSILSAAEREVTTTGGGQKNCTFGAVEVGPDAVFKSCFNSMTFAHNAIIGPIKAWPRGNSFPKNEGAVGFVNYNRGMDGDYRLCKDKDLPPPANRLRLTLMREATGRTWVPISTPSKPRLAEPNKTAATFAYGTGRDPAGVRRIKSRS